MPVRARSVGLGAAFKGVDLKVRPVHHDLDKRVRAHVFLCTLAYYVKASTRRTPDGPLVRSFQTLLDDLATLTRNRVRPTVPGAMTADMLARRTPLRAKAFGLLGASP